MKRHSSVWLLCLISALVAGPRAEEPTDSRAAAFDRSPVIVELFTSEGCSSCPTADVFLADLLVSQPVGVAEIIALAQHVDYWDELGWRDPYAFAALTRRQYRYAKRFGINGVYTPQLVVDGRQEMVASNRPEALDAIAFAARAPKGRIAITVAHAEEPARSLRLSVSVSGLPAIEGKSADVLLAITEDDLRSNVLRGENGGRQLAHQAVVRQLELLGTVSRDAVDYSGETTVSPPEGWQRAKLRAVVFVQDRGNGAILGAATVPLAVD